MMYVCYGVIDMCSLCFRWFLMVYVIVKADGGEACA